MPPLAEEVERKREERNAVLCIAAIAVMVFAGFMLLLVAIITDWQ